MSRSEKAALAAAIVLALITFVVLFDSAGCSASTPC